MNNFITEELQRIKLLSNYDNSKTLSEQQISKRERQLNNYYTKNSSTFSGYAKQTAVHKSYVIKILNLIKI